MSTSTVSLGEWESSDIAGVQLSNDDRRLLDQLRSRGNPIAVEEMRTGLRIRSSQYVGVVRFEQVTVHVRPKMIGLEAGLVAMVRYAAGLGALRRLGSSRAIDVDGSDLFDLLAALLTEATEELVRGGLLTDYVEHEELLPVVRGRLLYDRQFIDRFARLDRLWCRHDERDHATPENQLLQAALEACSLAVSHEPTRRHARILDRQLSELCGSLPAAWHPQEIAYHRLNEHYREAHALARAILDGAGPRSLLREGSQRSFAFFIDMNRLFQRFVERYLSELLAPKGVLVEPEEATSTVLHDVAAAKSYGTVRPDFVVRRRDQKVRLAMDAKYKDIAHRGVDPSDLYQAFLYASAWTLAAASPRSLLIFPVDHEGPVRWIEVRNLDRRPLGHLGLLGVSVARVLGVRPSEGAVVDSELLALAAAPGASAA